MKPEDIVISLHDAMQKGDFKKARTFLTDDFQFMSQMPAPLSADEWMDMSSVLRKAFPDLQYKFKLVGTRGSVLKTTAELGGTHKGDLDLTKSGLGVIPPTGKSFRMPIVHFEVTLQGDKISRYYGEKTEGAGVTGMLEALGVKMPTR